jgi:hypothetical protein
MAGTAGFLLARGSRRAGPARRAVESSAARCSPGGRGSGEEERGVDLRVSEAPLGRAGDGGRGSAFGCRLLFSYLFPFGGRATRAMGLEEVPLRGGGGALEAGQVRQVQARLPEPDLGGGGVKGMRADGQTDGEVRGGGRSNEWGGEERMDKLGE